VLTGGKAVTPQAYTREGPSRITERSKRQHFLYLSKASEDAQQGHLVLRFAGASAREF